MQNSLFALLLAVFATLFSGCGKQVFVGVFDKSIVGSAPKEAKISGDEYGAITLANKMDSNIEIRVQKMMASCSTERVRSIGSDFDGYILVEVYKNGVLAAKAQMDFKTEPSRSDFERVWAELLAALKWRM